MVWLCKDFPSCAAAGIVSRLARYRTPRSGKGTEKEEGILKVVNRNEGNAIKPGDVLEMDAHRRHPVVVGRRAPWKEAGVSDIPPPLSARLGPMRRPRV